MHEKGAFYIMAGNFATKFVTFFGSVFLARLLSKGDLGILSYMENLCSYAYLLMGLGMGNAILRYNIKYEDRSVQKGIAGYALKRGLINDLLLITVVVLVNAFYPHKGDFVLAKTLLPILIVALPFQDLINMVLMNERAFFANKRYAAFSLGSSFLIVMGRLLGAWKWDLKGVVLAVVLVNTISSLAMSASSYTKYYSNCKATEISGSLKKESSVYGLQYMITNGLWGFFMLIDIFLLGNLTENAVAVADYKIAYSMPANMAIFSSALGIFVASYFIKYENDKAWVKKNYIRLVKAGILMQGAVGIMLYVLAKPLIWMYGTQYYNVIPMMRLLVIGYFIDTALRFPTANILASIGKIKYNMIISAGGLIMEIILDIVLIPRFGGYGIAYATIIVRSLMAIALFIVFNKMYNVVGKSNNI